jgi:hypothetical protein
MTVRSSRWLLLAAWILVVVGLPLAGKWARRSTVPACALDGARINPLYRVRVVDAQGRDQEFCCIHCAELWCGQQTDRPRAVFVTDEVTGQEIDAASAWFVRSQVVTVPHTGNRIHAFRDRADAARHADAAHGLLLSDAEKPFGPVVTGQAGARARNRLGD